MILAQRIGPHFYSQTALKAQGSRRLAEQPDTEDPRLWAPNLAQGSPIKLASFSCLVAASHSWIINMDSEREHFCLESTVRGHHVYKSTWTPLLGQVLQTSTESGNEHDRFAVAVTKDDNACSWTPTTRNLQSGVVLSSSWWGDNLRNYWKKKEVWCSW